MLKQKVVKLACASLLATSILSTTGAVDTEASSAYQLQTKPIYMNNVQKWYKVIQQNGYQLVPASFFREMGLSVQWNSIDRAVIVSYKQKSVKLPIGAKHAYLIQNKQSVKHSLNTRTVLLNNQSYIPLAYVARTLGLSITYNEQLRAAVVGTSMQIQGSTNGSIVGNKYNVTDEELYWLYRITEAEAGGEPYEGKQAVAATVLNRTKAEGWPDNAVDVIFEIVVVNGKQYYQFEPVLNNYIYKVTPSTETKKAVNSAIRGEDPSNGAVVFYNPAKTTNKWILSRPIIKQIGNHVFAK